MEHVEQRLRNIENRKRRPTVNVIEVTEEKKKQRGIGNFQRNSEYFSDLRKDLLFITCYRADSV
jgi:hypothetical protein